MSNFQMPIFGSPDNMATLSNQLVSKADDLILQLTGQAFFTPFTIAIPNITAAAAPVPVLPPAPNLTEVTWNTPQQPGAFTQKPPDLHNLFPGPLTAVQPSLNFGNAPAAFSGTIPQNPSVDLNFTYPVVEQFDLPNPPSLLNISVADFNPFEIPQFTGEVPTLTVVAPTPTLWTESYNYTSSMLSLIQSELDDALTSDTDIGLSASVQQAMWDAAREREYRQQADALADLTRLEALGFALPHGVYLDARLKIQTETDYTITGLSRDIMVKQAELRLENISKCRELAVSLESKLIDYSNQVQQRLFEAARYQTEAMIQIYNAQVQAYTARVEGFKATIAVYDAQIRGIEAQIEQLKAQVAYEQTKAQIDQILVETYKAQIDAQVATLEIAKTQVAIIQTQANVEKTKVDVFSAEIQAYVGTVNAYTAQVEGYKANVEAQGAIENVYRTQVEAYTAQVQAGAAQATALVEGYKAQVQGYEAQLEAFKASLQAMVEQARAASEYNQAVTAEYTAQVQAQATYNDVLVKEWQAIITEQLQIAEMTSKVAEANVQLQISQRQITEEAIKGAATVMAQLGAAALGAIHWASNVNWSEGESYSNSISSSTANNDDHIYSEQA